MKILIVEPHKQPYCKDISGTLEELQAIVGGYIQAIYPFDEPIALVCNEEGKLIGLLHIPDQTCQLHGEFPPGGRRKPATPPEGSASNGLCQP